MAASDGSSGRTEEPVSGGCDLEKEERETLRKLIQETVREELKVAIWNEYQHGKRKKFPVRCWIFISDGAGVKGVRPMDKESMALLDLLGFACI